jgi:DNA topoisomerase-2
VAQLAGYVSEHSAYHHGEASLQSTIIGLAQDFVGSNNLNLLYPSGQFGTRLQGGKDAASARQGGRGEGRGVQVAQPVLSLPGLCLHG